MAKLEIAGVGDRIEVGLTDEQLAFTLGALKIGFEEKGGFWYPVPREGGTQPSLEWHWIPCTATVIATFDEPPPESLF